MTNKLLLLIIMLSIVKTGLPQKTGKMYLPALTNDTPEFFKEFYKENFPQGVNVFELDKKARKYEEFLENDIRAKRKEVIDQLYSTGEEEEDVYVLYYKRWRRSVDVYINEANGNIEIPLEEEVHMTNPTLVDNQKMNAAQWKVLGPIETFYPSYDDPAQRSIPWQLNITSIALAPSNLNVLYCGGETGDIYKTTDKGLNWSVVLDGNGFGCLTVDPANANIAYGAGNNSVVKTTDGGVTWNTYPVSSGNANTIIVHPVNHAVLFLAAEKGLFKSVNGGNSWNLIANVNTTVWDVVFKPNDPNTIYILKQIGTLTELHKSSDGGNTFNKSMTGWNSPAASNSGRMTVTDADPERVYVVVLGSTPDNVPYIFKSNDNGQNWTQMCKGTTGLAGNPSTYPAGFCGLTNGQGFYDLDIVASPNNADHLMVATTCAFKSTDGAVSFVDFGGYHGNFPIHPDIQEMIVSGNDTWIASDGGVNYSSDFFTVKANHLARNNGLTGSLFWGFTQGWNEDVVAGGRYHNGNTVIGDTYPSNKALRLGGGESATGHYLFGRPWHLAFDDIGAFSAPSTFNGIRKNISFTKFPNADSYGYQCGEIEFMPYCSNIIFLGNGNELWKSENGGISWVSVYNFNDRVKQFKISRKNGSS